MLLLLKWAWPTPVRGPPAKALQESAPVTTMEVTTTWALPAPLRPSTEDSMTREADGPIKDRLLGKLGNSTSWMCELLLSFIQLLAIHLAGRALFNPPSTPNGTFADHKLILLHGSLHHLEAGPS